MEIILDPSKTIEQNAALYYEKSKKAKKKLEGAIKALAETGKKAKEWEEKADKKRKIEQEKEAKKNVEKKWYEKFHWFISSEGFLCIGGRDATSNDIIVKKHLDKNDLIFHTDIAGSPFFIIKDGQNEKCTKSTKEEVAQATAAYSKAWKSSAATVSVFYVLPEQVSKQAQAGEYLAKGSFMVRGKKNYLNPEIKIAIGVKKLDNKLGDEDDNEGHKNEKNQNPEVIGGPINAIKKHAEKDKFVIITQGSLKKSEVAKKIKHLIGGDLDDIMKFLPTGGFKIQKNNQ